MRNFIYKKTIYKGWDFPTSSVWRVSFKESQGNLVLSRSIGMDLNVFQSTHAYFWGRDVSELLWNPQCTYAACIEMSERVFKRVIHTDNEKKDNWKLRRVPVASIV